ncbi:hypothetical protein ACIOJE_27210 [Kitasatospora sp. NPDC087861]|uniref:hypothetical protein n=1 Tax=Kitasatospora sp. NPDC087861 TaxID=3364070 RepID=UPI0037F1B673
MTTPDIIRARHEIFLRQTIAHSVGIARGPRGTTGAHADAAVNAWWAHRLLGALAGVMPAADLSVLLDDISEELEMGDAHEAAYVDAVGIGIDVDGLTAHAEAKFTTHPAA